MKNRRIALLFAVLFYSVSLRAQVDTLDEVNINAYRKQLSNDDRINLFSQGQRVKSIDSITLQQYQFQNIATLLAQQDPVFVKSYGFNNLSTLNFRGASAAQSQVYWNGVPLSNAATGITDVSLLRTSLYNKVSIVYGGSSALWGSGNIGGALVLENDRPQFTANTQYHYAISVMAGSFGQYQGGLRSSISMKRWFIATNLAAQSAQNNFKYTDNGTSYTTINSELSSTTGQVQIGYKANSKNTINFIAFGQNFYREIPKALFESLSVKNQRDASVRLLADWNRKGEKLNLSAKLSYVNDLMRYKDSMVGIDATYKTQQVYGELNVRYSVGSHHRFMLFLPVHMAWMERQQQADIVRQPRLGIAGAYNLSAYHHRLNIALHGRLRLNNDKSLPVSGLSIAYKCTDWLSVRTNIQRSYRLPTLEERYYEPGGNPNLKPEQGWSTDVGYTIKTKQEHNLVFYHDVSLFSRKIQDWIIWFGGAVWTPHNIAEVHSRGVETENRLQYKLNKWTLHLGVNTAYVLATTVQSYVANDGSIGKQIPYSPRYNGQMNIGLSYRKVYFNYNHTYTGYRFITVDESAWLEPYQTGNVQLMYSVPVNHKTLSLSVQCNNVWNAQYSVVNGRPMPRINWLIGLTLSL
jgi:iron complex outermembrane receptor protein